MMQGHRAHSDLASSFTCGAVEVSAASIDATASDARRLSALLSADEHERAGRFALDRDRRRYVAARGQLRLLLAERLGTPPESIDLRYGRRGKPALAGDMAESGWRFNLSHSNGLAVFALCRGREVGIDVEAVRALQDADGIAARFFSSREQAMYGALHPQDRQAAFFNCWTRKEAFIKALGDGLYHPLKCFDVTLAPGEPARILRVGDVPGDECGWRLDSFVPAPGYVAALVAQAPERREVRARAASSAPALP